MGGLLRHTRHGFLLPAKSTLQYLQVSGLNLETLLLQSVQGVKYAGVSAPHSGQIQFTMDTGCDNHGIVFSA
ncbi:hypothetical protein S1OALGB6SA_897 [Olavius algarvensis spirochete endosymbiont]|nr:MAG: hypothetical protein [Olavius algarvensis spirochete endosymbiont]VDA99824.1 hypothetical protein S1OALGB6SA_897 [Olavius algarvensis spirochete endosymbiont]